MSEADVHGELLFDLTRSVPVLGAIRDHLEARRWHDAADLLNEIRAAGEDQLAIASEAMAAVPGIEVCLDDIVRSEPESADARALRSHRMLALAGALRAGKVATEEDEDEVEAFERIYRAVEQELIVLCAQNPTMGLAWYLRCVTAYGLSTSTSEARRRYERLMRSHPHHFSAQHRMLMQLAPSSGGSREALLAFARDCANVAPPASPSRAMVVAAHFEVVVQMSERQRGAYLADPLVEDDLMHADSATVGDPAFGSDLHATSLHSLFAILWSFSGDRARARPHFDALGSHAAEIWFGRFADPATMFQNQREQAFADETGDDLDHR